MMLYSPAMKLRHEPWLDLLPTDPRPALLASDEPSARFVALTKVMGMPEDAPETRAARASVVADPGIRALVSRLPAWKPGLAFGGHNSPAFPPNLLRLLYVLGIRGGDFPAIERALDAMLRHQADDGRFLTPGGTTGKDAAWASLPCDHFAMLEALILFGRHGAPQIDSGLARVSETIDATTQGPGWKCIPDPVARWRGPGRKDDVCLQVTIEALRLSALVAASARPRKATDAARTVLRAWRVKGTQKPYMFGHGRRFVEGKWPPTWYDASAVLETMAAYPAVWKSGSAASEDR
ncbi:MAG TPA: hypothetical protein VLH81_13770, partial [Desulfobacterales bacterium]|nr:hypothetical protein [Desulfobacterales bacterium]